MNEQNLSLKITVHRASLLPSRSIFPNNILSPKRKVQYYELVIFLEDGGYFNVNGKKYQIRARTARLYRPGDIVYSYRFGDIYAVHFSIDGEETGKRVLDDIPHYFNLSNMDEDVKIINKLTVALLDQNTFECAGLLFQLLFHIREQIKTQNKAGNNMYSIKKYIDANYSENITLSALAEKFYLHPVYLQRVFKKEFGSSPAEYICAVRIRHAKLYLLSTDMPVEEISDKTGFCNPSYFIRSFKNREGITPSRFRRSMQNFIE